MRRKLPYLSIIAQMPRKVNTELGFSSGMCYDERDNVGEDMAKSKILITGGTGYIGSHTAVELIEAGYEVAIVDNLANSKMTVVEKIAEITGVKPQFDQVDLLNLPALERVFREGEFETVIHFAGLKAVGESVEQPLRYYETNLGSTINLLKCMLKYNVKRLVFSSSATVYGNQPAPLDESRPTGSGISNPYGWTKFMIEEIIKDVCAAHPEFSATLLRYFNPVGAHPSGLIGEDPNGRPNNLMPIIMKVATGEMPVLAIYGNDYDTPDGTCVRDYIHVVDLAKGHLAALDKMHAGVQIYNLGTGKGVSVLEMVEAFTRASGKPLPHKIVGRRAGDLAVIYASPEKARAELGWQTELSLDDIMNDTLNYLRHKDA